MHFWYGHFAATIGVGMAVTTVEKVIIAHIAHAIFTTIIAVIVSLIYYSKFNYTTALQTAAVFVAFIIIVDFFGVALLINKSLEMFMSPLGTWIPFMLIFVATYLTRIFEKICLTVLFKTDLRIHTCSLVLSLKVDSYPHL
jgi:hypothetical protein